VAGSRRRVWVASEPLVLWAWESAALLLRNSQVL